MRTNGSLIELSCKTKLEQFKVTHRGPHIRNKII